MAWFECGGVPLGVVWVALSVRWLDFGVNWPDLSVRGVPLGVGWVSLSVRWPELRTPVASFIGTLLGLNLVYDTLLGTGEPRSEETAPPMGPCSKPMPRAP